MKISSGEFVWFRPEPDSFKYFLSGDLYWGGAGEDVGVCSLRDGSLIRACSLALSNRRFSNPPVIKNGVLRAWQSESGQYYEYNANTDTERVWLIDDTDFKGRSNKFLTTCGDDLILHDHRLKRLQVYSLTEGRFIEDKPFDPETFLPRPCEGPDDFECRVSEVLWVYRTDAGYAFKADERGNMHLSDIPRVYLFELDELDKDPGSIQIEHEGLSSRQERVLNEDGSSAYRVYFDQPQPFQKLFRHARVEASNVMHNYGKSTYPDAKTDKQWTGLLRIDLRNQSLTEEQRWLFGRLPASISNFLDFLFRAGVGGGKRIEIVVEFADD